MITRSGVRSFGLVMLLLLFIAPTALVPFVGGGVALGGETLFFWLQVGYSLVSLAIALVFFIAFRSSNSVRLWLIGLAFLARVIPDLLHGLSAPGGVTFLQLEDANVALGFRALGGLLVAGLLLGAHREQARARSWLERWPNLVGWTLVAISVLVVGVALLNGPGGIWLRENPRLAGGLAVSAALLQAVVASIYWHRFQRLGDSVLRNFAIGFLALALAEVAIVGAESLYDLVAWTSEAYRLFAFACLGLGLWRLLRPVDQPI